MDGDHDIPNLRKGGRSAEGMPWRERHLRRTAILVSLMLYLCVTLTLMLDNGPAMVRVREAVYSDRPLGLPWQVVHAIVFALLFAPFPLWCFSVLRIGFLCAEHGQPFGGIIEFGLSYRALSAIPEARPHVRRVLFISLGYFVLFAGWIVFTAWKGI